jgi:hypothetical protein
MNQIGKYLSDLSSAVGGGWNRFWFTSRGIWHLALLRQIVGLLAFVWLASYSFQLTDLFGQTGALSLKAVHTAVTGGDPNAAMPGLSHFFFIHGDGLLWASHVAGLVALLLVVLGVFPRLTTPLGLLVVLSYIHRGSIITGQFEPVLCMLLLYLSLAPSDGLSRLIRAPQDASSWSANLVTRLIQVHLCGFYGLMGLSKLGARVWWTGDGAWYLINDVQQRLVDVTYFSGSNYLLNGITHAWVLFELLFPLLIWIRLARPLVIFVSVIVWLWTAAVTGLVGFSVLMIVANLAWVPSDTVAGWFRKRRTSMA